MKCSTVTIFFFSRKGEKRYFTPGWDFVCSHCTLVTDYVVEICCATDKRQCDSKVCECVGEPSYFISRMDFFGEIIALGIDTVLFGLCYRLYVKQRNAIEKVEVCV